VDDGRVVISVVMKWLEEESMIGTDFTRGRAASMAVRLIVATLLMSLVAACASPGAVTSPSATPVATASAAAPSASEAPSASQATTPGCGTDPVVLNAYFETGFDIPFKLSEEFTKQFPNVTWDIKQDQFTNLMTATPRLLSGDNPPDLIRLPSMVSLVKDGLLKNLDYPESSDGPRGRTRESAPWRAMDPSSRSG